MITTRHFFSIIPACTLILAACAAPSVTTAPSPEAGTSPAAPPIVAAAPVPPPNPSLPPVPHVTGPLAIRIVYPPAGHLIQSKDSNFIFGSVGNGDAGLTINGVLTPVWPNGSFMAFLANPPADAPQYDIVATTGAETARLVHPVKIAPPPSATPVTPATMVPMSAARYAALIGPAAYASDTERVVTGYSTAYPTSGGIERWFLLPGTAVRVIGTLGNYHFVMLDSTQTIAIEKNDLKMLDSLAPAPASLNASPFTVENGAEWTDIIIPITGPPPFLVEEGPASLTLTLYGTRSSEDRQGPLTPAAGSYVTSAMSLRNRPRTQYLIPLAGPIYGYQPLWENGKFTFRVRRPPVVDSTSSLRGLTIALDPGHPPAGATGPTGLYEADAALAVGLKARDLLQAKGANVFMTRSTPDTVDLNLRSTLARRANAHALVSIHLNAVGDGINPFRAQGTETYHYHLHSAPLANAIQGAAVPQLGLPDHGVKRMNFALVRGPWMPAVLVEGAFIIMPDLEAALRTPEYQQRYAQGIVDGLEAYFRSLAAAEK
ncbi:MAG: N-acetylmuramoyl-L-alanine amidase [Gemmatimonadales bacterium]